MGGLVLLAGDTGIKGRAVKEGSGLSGGGCRERPGADLLGFSFYGKGGRWRGIRTRGGSVEERSEPELGGKKG